jgi:hypothetical protein
MKILVSKQLLRIIGEVETRNQVIKFQMTGEVHHYSIAVNFTENPNEVIFDYIYGNTNLLGEIDEENYVLWGERNGK